MKDCDVYECRDRARYVFAVPWWPRLGPVCDSLRFVCGTHAKRWPWDTCRIFLGAVGESLDKR